MFEHIPVTLAQQDSNVGAPPPNLPDSDQEAPATDTTNGTADTGADSNAPPPADPPGGSIFGNMMPLVILLGFVVLLFVMTGRQQRKERKRRDAMLAAIKKGDRIQTVGGIRGTLVEVRDDEVTVKVDENANTRLRFARSAIQNVLTDEPDKE